MKCIVKTLKECVNNDNLPVWDFGNIVIAVESTTQAAPYVQINPIVDKTVKADISGATWKDWAGNEGLSSLVFPRSISTLDGRMGTASTTPFVMTINYDDKANVSAILISNNVVNIIKGLTDVPNLERFSFDHCKYSGDLAETFGACIKLNLLKSADNRLTGSIEDFVKAQRANGRVVCEGMTIGNIGNVNSVTFNDIKPTTTSDSQLSWTENTITLDGVTVNA